MRTVTVAEAGRGTKNASKATKRIAPRALILMFIHASLGTPLKTATRMPCHKSLSQGAFARAGPSQNVGAGFTPARAPTRTCARPQAHVRSQNVGAGFTPARAPTRTRTSQTRAAERAAPTA